DLVGLLARLLRPDEAEPLGGAPEDADDRPLGVRPAELLVLGDVEPALLDQALDGASELGVLVGPDAEPPGDRLEGRRLVVGLGDQPRDPVREVAHVGWSGDSSRTPLLAEPPLKRRRPRFCWNGVQLDSRHGSSRISRLNAWILASRLSR